MTKKKKNENYLGNNRHLSEVQELLKSYAHLDQTNEFVGSQFSTPKGGVLTVVGMDRLKCNDRKYTMHCSLCSRDVELWGPEYISSSVCNLRNNQIPCGCGCGVKWSESQYKILIERECSVRCYLFHGWYDGFNGASTKLNLENPKTNNKWHSCSINNFLRGRRDPIEGRKIVELSRTRSDDDWINIFTDNCSSPKLYDFKRADKTDYRGAREYFEYKCKVCSCDEYVKAGVCNGIFTSHVNTLKRGHRSCRCSNRFCWSKQQREYQIQKVCKEKGYIFIGWENGYENSHSKVKWICSDGHECCNEVWSFINGAGCTVCADKYRGHNGYIQARSNEKDYLYLQLSSDWVKCGRSFNPKERIKKNSKNSDYIIDEIALYSSNHEKVFDIEQKVKYYMVSANYNFYPTNEHPWAGSGECYLRHQENIDLIRKMIHESGLEIVHENGFL